MWGKIKLMKHIFVLLFFILISFKAFSDTEVRRKRLIKVLDSQIKEITRLNKRTRSRNPDLLLQMAELLLEKGRLIRDKENQEYLVLPIKKRRRISKKVFFKKSNRYFYQAQKTSVVILKRFPNYSKKSEVYYILAYNAKEFQKYKQAQKYFKYSITNNKTKESSKTYIALAEMYFNQKKYVLAESYYKKGITKNNKWWTKDSYNYAWSMFQNGKKKKAINLMHKVYFKSQSNSYIDMRESSRRELSFMYVESGMVQEAVRFFKSINKDIPLTFYRMSKMLKNRGRFSLATKLLATALKHSKNDKLIIKIKIEQLSLFERFAKSKNHLKTCQDLLSFYKKGLLTKSQKEIYLYHIKRASSIIQKQIASDVYKNEPKILKRKAMFVSKYLQLFAMINIKARFKAYFLSAEALYAANDYNSAIPLYDKSFIEAKNHQNKKFTAMSLRGLLAALGKKNVNKQIREKYLTYSYLLILKNSKSKRKRKLIYQRLFKRYIKKKNIVEAETTMKSFSKDFPRSNDKTEAMTAEIVDFYVNTKNKAKIEQWAKIIVRKKSVYSYKFRAKIRSLVLTLQFENVEKARHSGDFKAALKGYVSIYKDQNSSSEAKKNASYNISVLFHQLGNANLTHKWIERSLTHMSLTDIKQKSDSILLMIILISEMGYPYLAIQNYDELIMKTCGKNIKNKDIFFRNNFLLNLGLNKYLVAQKTLHKMNRCKVKKRIKSMSHLDFVQYLYYNKHYTLLGEELLNNTYSYLENYSKYIYYSSKLSTIYLKNSHLDESERFNKLSEKFYLRLKRNKKILSLTSADQYFSKNIDLLKRMANFTNNIKLKFPENTFNRILQKRISSIDKLTDKTNMLSSKGSGELYVSSYKLLVNSYQQLVNDIRSFVPPGKSKSYISSFRMSMKSVVNSFERNIRKVKYEVRSRIIKDELFSESNYYFLSKKPFKSKILNSSIMMERMGQR